jgi:AsmA protein
MRRTLKWLGIAAAVLVVSVVSLPFLINVDQFKPVLESELSTALNRAVKLGNLKLSLLAGEVTADDLSVAEDQAFGNPAFLQAKSLSVGAEIWPFLRSRKLVVTYLTIDQPQIALMQAPSGDWNFSSLGARSAKAAPPAARPPGTAPLDLSVKLVRITNGRVSLGRRNAHWKPLALEQVNLELRDFSATTAFPFTFSASVVGGGTIQLDGQAGPINPTDSAMTPMNASLKVMGLDLARSGMNHFAPNIAGMIGFEGKGASDGRLLKVDGKLKAEKMKLARNGTAATRPMEVDFTVQHDLRKHSGSVRQTIHIGGAAAHLAGTYAERDEAMLLSMKLSGPEMPVPELEGLLPALGVTLPAGSRLEGGTASVILAMEGPADRLVTSGSLSLNRTRLAGFDLPKKMASIERLAGIQSGGPNMEIDVLSADVRVGPEGASAQDMKLVLPAIGDLSGAGTVSPANDLNFRMTAVVHTTGMAAVVRNTPIPFTVEGTCADPVFRPDVKAVVKEEVKGIEKSAGGLLKGLLGGSKK